MSIRIAPVLALAALLAPAGARADSRIERTLKLAPGGKLRVETEMGSVSVTATAQNDVRVVVTSRRDDLSERLALSFDEEPGVASIIGKKKHRGGWFSEWRGQVHFEIQVPTRTQVDVRTSGGSVTLTGTESRANLYTSGGSIQVRRLAGELRAETSGGSIALAEIRGEARVETSGGAIEARSIGGALTANTSGGSVEIEDVQGDIRARTSGGSMHIRGAGGLLDAETSGGGIEASFTKGNARGGRLESSGGSVRVSLDPAVDLTIEASGDAVHTDVPLRMEGEISRRHVHGDLNHGGATLRVGTSGGSVHIEPI